MKVPETKTSKSRLHLDIQAGGGRAMPWEQRWPRVTALVEQLVAAGREVVQLHDLSGQPDHVVMADPEGNEFCVV